MIEIHSIKSEPKVLIWDIETAKGYAKVPFYQLKQYSKFLNHKHVERPVTMVCLAWKWVGEGYIGSTSVLKDKERFEACHYDDYHVVKTAYNLICDADVIVAHNGDNFDWKMFRWRCLCNGFEPPPKPLMVDTLKIARKEFRAESNTLSYLARALGVEDKDNSPNWDKIFEGCPKEIAYAERYCRQDIRTLEGVYEKLRPYATIHANLNSILNGVHHHTCPKCGHWDLQRRGYRYTQAGKYQAYQCKSDTGGCGGWSQGKKNLKTVEIR